MNRLVRVDMVNELEGLFLVATQFHILLGMEYGIVPAPDLDIGFFFVQKCLIRLNLECFRDAIKEAVAGVGEINIVIG